MFTGPVPICTELSTPAGAIDNFMVTPSGLPVLVECKLWRNPEGRREVIGQILDYAKELIPAALSGDSFAHGRLVMDAMQSGIA